MVMNNYELKPCPFCGKTKGFFAKIYGMQLYDNHGNEAGYTIDKESKTVRCINCGHRINLKALQKKMI